MRVDFGCVDFASEDGDSEGSMEQLGTWVSIAVVALSWWMLFMTAAYFHTWFEKVRLKQS